MFWHFSEYKFWLYAWKCTKKTREKVKKNMRLCVICMWFNVWALMLSFHDWFSCWNCYVEPENEKKTKKKKKKEKNNEIDSSIGQSNRWVRMKREHLLQSSTTHIIIIIKFNAYYLYCWAHNILSLNINRKLCGA